MLSTTASRARRADPGILDLESGGHATRMPAGRALVRLARFRRAAAVGAQVVTRRGLMKRNETVLVYGATALLLVILGVAVLFGNDGAKTPGNANENRMAQSLEDLLLPKKPAET